MLDLRAVLVSPAATMRAMEDRGADPRRIEQLVSLDHNHRAWLTELQQMQARRNEITPLIGQALKAGDKDTADRLKGEMKELKVKIDQNQEMVRQQEETINIVSNSLPNIPAEDVPVGADETANVELYRIGSIPEFEFTPKDHVDLGALHGMDFESAAKVSGSRFVYLKGDLARLERALGQFMLDYHTERGGFMEVAPPLLVNGNAMYGTGQLPKFEQDLFKIDDDGREHWLIPTAEVSLTNLVRDSIMDAEELPLRMTALTPCFRAEAGSAGRDTRGMIRQHQFNKVELVSICTAEQAEQEHSYILESAEAILLELGLPYRAMLLCTGDMGFSAKKTVDLEVWLPSQNAYREISSVSWCGDFQGRRMQARYRENGQNKMVHTLNGSGLAVGRALVAVLENYQTEDGSILIPMALHEYMGDRTKIAPIGKP